MARHARLAVADHDLANPAPHAVGANQGGCLQGFTVRQMDGHVVGRLLKRLDLGAGAQAHVGPGLAGAYKNLVQVGAVNHAIGKAVSRPGHVAQGDANDFLAAAHIVHGQAGREKCHAVDGFGQAQVVKHPEDVGPQLDTRTDFTKAGGLFQHGDRMAILRQHQSRRQAAYAAAGNNEGKCLCHVLGRQVRKMG